MTRQLVSARVPHHIEVVHVLTSWRFLRQLDPFSPCEGTPVFSGDLATPGGPARQVPQLHREHSGLKSVHATVDTLNLMITFCHPPMAREHGHPLSKNPVVRQYGTRITHRAQILAGIERE